MFFKKFLNQPNLVGTVLIALMVCSGFVYAFAFDGFNVETVTGGEVEEWLAAAGGGGSGGGDPDPVLCDCLSSYMVYEGCSTDLCESDGACGDDKAVCSDNCAHENSCSTCAIDDFDDIQCANEGELCGDNPEACGEPNDPMDDDTRNGDGGRSGVPD